MALTEVQKTKMIHSDIREMLDENRPYPEPRKKISLSRTNPFSHLSSVKVEERINSTFICNLS